MSLLLNMCMPQRCHISNCILPVTRSRERGERENEFHISLPVNADRDVACINVAGVTTNTVNKSNKVRVCIEYTYSLPNKGCPEVFRMLSGFVAMQLSIMHQAAETYANHEEIWSCLLCEKSVARLQAAGFVCTVLLAEGALELVGAHA